MAEGVPKEEAYEVTWYPDTCDCIITFVSDFTKSKALKRCLLHRNVADDQILSTVLKHNQSFNLKVFDAMDKVNDAKLREEAKRLEKAKSRGEAVA